jgi:hypothetical protein
VLAAALLRHLHAVITSGQQWNPAIAAGGRTSPALAAASPHRRAPTGLAAGASPTRHRDATSDLACHPGQPRPSPGQPDYTLPGTIPMTAMQGPATEQGTGQALLTTNALR